MRERIAIGRRVCSERYFKKLEYSSGPEKKPKLENSCLRFRDQHVRYPTECRMNRLWVRLPHFPVPMTLRNHCSNCFGWTDVCFAIRVEFRQLFVLDLVPNGLELGMGLTAYWIDLINPEVGFLTDFAGHEA